MCLHRKCGLRDEWINAQSGEIYRGAGVVLQEDKVERLRDEATVWGSDIAGREPQVSWAETKRVSLAHLTFDVIAHGKVTIHCLQSLTGCYVPAFLTDGY